MKKLSKLFITVFAVLIAAFTLASCNKNEDKFSGTAKDLINRLILTENGTEVAADFTVPGTISAQDVTVDITWTSKNENYLKFVKNEDNTYTAQITKQDERVTAEFSAAVTYNNETASKDFKVRISRIIKPEEVVTNFYDAEKGAAVSVTGYITYLGQYSSSYKNFCLYMTDSNYLGGFYAYRVTTTQEIYDQLKVGSAVTVTGEKDIYSQGHQIGSGASIALADLPAYEAPEAYDATNDFILNEGNTMLYNTARYVTLKGMKVTKVNELNLEGSTSQTLVYLERAGRVANIATNGYLNEPSGSNSANYIAVNEVTKTLKVDDYVDVTGYLSNFNGTWQLIVLNAEDVVKTSAPTLSDAELVIEAMQVFAEGLKTVYSKNETVALPATGSNNVALTYEVTAGSTAKVENGNLVITPTADEVTVSLKVSGTLNGVSNSVTVEFTTQLPDADASTHELYMSAADGTELTVTATVVASGVSSSGKGKAVIQDENGAYFVTASDVTKEDWTAKFVPAHTVTVKGERGTSSAMAQLVVASLDDVTLGAEATKVEALDVTDLVKAGLTPESNPELEGMYVVVKNATYDGSNLNVDGKGIQYYPDWSFPTPTVEPEKDGVYTVAGYLQRYNSKYEISPLFADDVVEVTAAPEPEPEPTITADLVIAPSVTETTKPAEGEISNLLGSPEGVSIVYALNQAGKNVLAICTDQIRLYGVNNYEGLEGVGNSLTFTFEGKTVAAIKISYDTEKPGQLKLDDKTLDVIGSDHAYDIVTFDTPVSTFKLTTISATQARITKIEIQFAE